MYHEFYGLREGPFGLTPDAKYLFASESHREALAHIAYGIEERRGFVLILGEVGTGKTTLIRHVLKRLTQDVKAVFVFNSNLGFEELLQAVLRDLEVPLTSRRRGDLIEALNEYLLAESAAGRRVVVIIDEAQHLSPSVLEDIRMLSNLETAKSKLLQIVLVGQPELGARLGKVQLRQVRQRIGLVAELKPLSRRDTARYVKHRLAIAGCSRPVFTRAALGSIHRSSEGIPRLINVICDKSLVLGYAGNKRRIGLRIVRQVARDWAAFKISTPDAPAQRWRDRDHRARRAGLGLPLRPIAAVAIASALAAGFLVVRPRTLGQPTEVESPVTAAPAGPTAPLTAEGGSRADALEPPARELRAAGTRPEDPLDPVIPYAETRWRAPDDAVPEPAPPPPSTDVLTVPAVSRSSEPPVAVVTMQAGDTLPLLLQRVYGRTDDTVVDVVQLANPDIGDGSLLRSGQRLRFPPVEPAAMVHKLADRRYVVHLLTSSDPMDRRLQQLSAVAAASGRMVRLVPVRLWTGCQTCVRMWVGEFSNQYEAESFYRRVRFGEAA